MAAEKPVKIDLGEFKLPFDTVTAPKDHDHSDFNQCGIYRILPPEGKAEAEKNPYLLDYLHMIPIESIGMPKIVTSLDRKMNEVKVPNFIYPAGDDIYIHIYGCQNYPSLQS
jgi:flagellar protein FlaI